MKVWVAFLISLVLPFYGVDGLVSYEWVTKVGVGQWLTQSEMETNALKVYDYFCNNMSKAAIAGLLANMQSESGINSGNKQGANGAVYGWGFIQWTPAQSALVQYAPSGTSWSDATWQCSVILQELYNRAPFNGRWSFASPSAPNYNNYKYSQSEFMSLTDPREAAICYMLQRERPSDQSIEAQQRRADRAEAWWNYLGGGDYNPTPRPPGNPKKTKTIMMLRNPIFYRMR